MYGAKEKKVEGLRAGGKAFAFPCSWGWRRGFEGWEGGKGSKSSLLSSPRDCGSASPIRKEGIAVRPGNGRWWLKRE